MDTEISNKGRLLDRIIQERKGHYCHLIEVDDTYAMESIAEGIIDCYYPEFTEEEIIEFLESLGRYPLEGANEDEIFKFSFREFIEGTL